jgi:hypothetical protein
MRPGWLALTCLALFAGCQSPSPNKLAGEAPVGQSALKQEANLAAAGDSHAPLDLPQRTEGPSPWAKPFVFVGEVMLQGVIFVIGIPVDILIWLSGVQC